MNPLVSGEKLTVTVQELPGATGPLKQVPPVKLKLVASVPVMLGAPVPCRSALPVFVTVKVWSAVGPERMSWLPKPWPPGLTVTAGAGAAATSNAALYQVGMPR